MDKTNIANIDYNLGNPNILEKYNSQDHLMLKNVLVGLFYSYQNSQLSFDGTIKIDPYVLARNLGLSPTSLRKPHPSPFQKKKLGEKKFFELEQSGQLMYKTVFENCLYMLLHYNEEQTVRIKNNDGSVGQTTQMLRFLDSLKISLERGKGSPKKYYNVRLNDYAKRNYSGYFLRIHLDEYKKLKSSNCLTNLYFYLVKLRTIVNSQETKIGRPSFDILVELCEVQGEPKNMKRSINRAFDLIKERCSSLGLLGLNWVGKGRWKYEPEITFDFDLRHC